MASSATVIDTGYRLVEELVRLGESAVALDVAEALRGVLHDDDFSELRDRALAGLRAETNAVRRSAKVKLGAAYTGPEPDDETPSCCRFHATGGAPGLSCGGDVPAPETDPETVPF